MRNLVTCLLVASASNALAQTVHVKGVVSQRSGTPVTGAVVALKVAGLRDTTAFDGVYSLDREALATSPTAHRSKISVVGGDLVVSLEAPAPLTVEFFDLAGSLVASHSVPEAGVGEHRIPLRAASEAGVALVVRVTVGSQVSSFRTFGKETGDAWFPAPVAARTLAVVDTLLVSATGFVPARVPVPSYEQKLDVVLDSMPKAARSAGCDKTRTIADGTLSITSGGKTRKYILKTPAAYDKSQAHRLVFAFAESGSSAQSVANRNYFRMGTYDTKGTIFVAPDAENGAGSWSKADVTLTDDILAKVEGDLCIDKSRIFATGFSFGGAMSLALACTRADVFRGVAFFSGADLTGSCPSTPLTKPIAYYASQASGDASGAPIPTSGRIKQAQFAAVNGCTAEANSTTFPAAGKAHTCTVYKNCKAGYPTVYCVFDGPHGWEPVDPGQSTSWNPVEAWKFISQF